MGNKKKFINPLTRSSEEDLNIPKVPESTHTVSSVSPSPSEFQPVRNRGNRAFEKTHQRFTGWMDNNLKKQFVSLAQDKGVSKTSLLNEAIADLIRKYMEK